MTPDFAAASGIPGRPSSSSSVVVGSSGGSVPPPASSSGRYPSGSSGLSVPSAPPVRVSFLGNMMTFNFGRELFVYPYSNGSILEKPLDKRVYKGTCPTCHDFADRTLEGTTSEGGPLSLLVGFSGGQIQLLDPLIKELSLLYNEDRFVDKTRVTVVKWLPGSPEIFLVSHASGNIYVYDRNLPPIPSGSPSYALLKKGEGFSVFVQGKAKSSGASKNPVLKWSVGQGSINEFAFSPCGSYLAVVGQDGYLRIFNYDAMEPAGTARSYFGGLLCVSWSPDGKYIVTGGEDDLVTVYSFLEKRVVVRGQGHKSWVSVVAFDPYNMSFVPDGFEGSDREEEEDDPNVDDSRRLGSPPSSSGGGGGSPVTGYRFGSVGQDTYICLWDITEDILKSSGSSSSSSVGGGCGPLGPAAPPSKSSNASSPNSSLGALTNASVCSKDSGVLTECSFSTATSTSLSQRLASLNFGSSDRKDKRGSHSNGGSKSSSRSSSASLPVSSSVSEESVKLGSLECPRIYEIPLIEPLVVKKVAHERLTALVFREEYLVTACQDGYVRTWARPGKMSGTAGNASPIPHQNSPPSSTRHQHPNNNSNSLSHNPGTSSQSDGGTIV